MSGVKVIVRNADGDLVQLASFIDRGGWEVRNNAEEGSPALSTLFMDDLDESVYDTLGLNDGARRQFRLVDYDSNKIVHFGYTSRRTIRRKYDIYGSPLGRAWGIEIEDPNAILSRRILTHKAAKRPREDDIERMQALFDMPEWDLIHQFILPDAHRRTMSKADYRGQTVGDYISDCSQQTRKNYWVDMVDLGEGDGEELTLWYARDNAANYASTLSISNDMADLDVEAISEGTTTLVYPPAMDTEYTMDPTRVYSGIYLTWEKGSVYRYRNTTGTAFERHDTAMQFPNIHEKDRAEDRAVALLDRFDEEDERIETAILVPSTQAHLVRAGMRMNVKLTHVPRMADGAECRILSRGLSPAADGQKYLIPLTLELLEPGDPTPPVTSCSTVLGDAVVAAVSDQVLSGSGGIAISMNITPVAAEPALLFMAASGYSGVNATNDMEVTGSWTSIYHANMGAGNGYRPSTAVGYQHVAVPAGATACTAEYQGPNFPTGLGRYYGITAVSIETAETSPVQSKGAFAKTITFDTPPTAENMLVMTLVVRGEEEPPTETLIGPGWTLVSSCTNSENVTAQYLRCVESGDGSQYGIVNAGISAGTFCAVSEVALT